MIDDLETHLFDLLAANDAILHTGGSAWAAGWSGTKRVETGDVPAAGYVNLIESTYNADGAVHRPGIYLGLKGVESSDRLAYETAAAPADHTEAHILTIPLVIAVQAPTKLAARRQRNQLRQNVKSILFAHRIETNHWYWLEMTGQSGSVRDIVWLSSSGGGAQQVAEAMCLVPVAIHYMWNGASPA